MKYLYIATLIFITSCGNLVNNSGNIEAGRDSEPDSTKSATIKLSDKTVKFLWRSAKYEQTLKDSINSIFINEDYCKTITDPERAALGYVATFVGNECNWDGNYTDDRSNLKCKILTALNLGYQCSEKHLGFLRNMFKSDTNVLKELKSDNCPTTPEGATIQETFEEITLTVKGNELLVFSKLEGINMREGKSWTRTETARFKFESDHIELIKKEKSEVKHQTFDTRG